MNNIEFKYYNFDAVILQGKRLHNNVLRAAYRGDLSGLKESVKEDPLCVKLQDAFTGCTALHFSAGLGNYSCVEFLLSCEHVDLMTRDFSGMDALDKAFHMGHAGVYKLIAEAMWPDPEWPEAGGSDDPSGTPPDKTTVVRFSPRPR